MPDAQQTEDPIPVILARMEVKLDNALSEQARHATELTSHDGRIDRVEDRMTALETKHSTEDVGTRITALEKRMWTWVGASAVISSLLVTYGPRLIGG